MGRWCYADVEGSDGSKDIITGMHPQGRRSIAKVMPIRLHEIANLMPQLFPTRQKSLLTYSQGPSLTFGKIYWGNKSDHPYESY
jgi:hypothetical protein